MATTQAILQGKDTTAQGELYSSFELGDKQWKITASDGKRSASRYSVEAGDTAAVIECLRKAKVRFGLGEQAQVHSCYEAGRDGWWLHRWLIERGIDNIVVDSASIEVNRRARRAKNDRLDGDKLLAMLLRWHAGERRLWSVLRSPTVQEEDAGAWNVNLTGSRMSARRTATGSARCWCCTTCGPGASAGEPGTRGGRRTRKTCRRPCVRKSNGSSSA
jgi:transposase